jgi:DmsE family decaheme c-type cytochrome
MMRTSIRCSVRSWYVLALAVAVISAPAAALAQDDAEEPEYSKAGADTCFKCHDDQVVLSIFRTRHAVPSDPNSPFGHGQLQCEACHGPGGDHTGRVRRGQERPPMVRFGSDSGTPIAEQNSYCLDCHQSNVGVAWHGSGHDSNEVACADCHDSHVERDPVLTASTQSAVCTDCHQQQRTQSMKAFAHPLQQGKMSCGSCHQPHGDNTDGLLARATLNQTCYDCHAELRGPYLWEHAPAADDCSSCHEPHGSNHPGMLSARAPLLCQSCHSSAGHPSLPQDERGLPAGTPSQFLLGRSCLNCHSQVHGSNHPSGTRLMR